LLKVKIFNVLLSLFVLFLSLDFSNNSQNFSAQNYYDYNKSAKVYNLKVPSINLDVSFFASSTLDVGLEVHEVSFEINSPVLIMGHSGIGPNVYFNDLDKLKIGDKILFENKVYNLVHIYEVSKKNSVFLKRSNKFFYLITCHKKNMDKQLLFEAKMQEN